MVYTRVEVHRMDLEMSRLLWQLLDSKFNDSTNE